MLKGIRARGGSAGRSAGGSVTVHRTVIHLLDRDLDSTAAHSWPMRDDYLRWHKLAVLCRTLHRDGLDYSVSVEPHNRRIVIGAAGHVRPSKPSKLYHTPPPPPPPNEAQAGKALESATRELRLCRDALAAQWSWWRRRPGQAYPLCRDAKTRERRRRFGHWLASRLALRPRGWRDLYSFVPNLADYRSGDEVFGLKLPRMSGLPASTLRGQGWIRAVARHTFGIWWKCRSGRLDESQVLPKQELDKTARLTCPEWVVKFRGGHARDEPSAIRRYQEAKAEVEYWQEIMRLLEERKNGNQGQA